MASNPRLTHAQTVLLASCAVDPARSFHEMDAGLHVQADEDMQTLAQYGLVMVRRAVGYAEWRVTATGRAWLAAQEEQSDGE